RGVYAGTTVTDFALFFLVCFKNSDNSSFLLTFLTLVDPLANVAPNGQATQSSLYANNVHAVNVINGDMTGLCSHTANQSSPWWKLDLLAVHRVLAVTIFNRPDCCPERLIGAEILIGNSPSTEVAQNPRCGTISSVEGTLTHTFHCGDMEGRYVVVILPGQKRILSLCEVEVYASLAGVLMQNVALSRTADQSSSHPDGPARNAVDGNRDPNFAKGSCSLTHQESNPWWRVDLQNVYTVTAVMITNRNEFENRLDGAEIWIGNSLEDNGAKKSRCAIISHIPKGRTFYFPCSSTEGRYVTVFLPGTKKILSLCDVQNKVPNLRE
uniref:Fucolectin tachylectin-4 pentraxin-1 domain-containing protein n=1 Tax=Labrus bergylta TaxID=56723 RepID=A0A3Q3G3X8_9LABR